MAIKFCVKCGTKFNAMGREVICPACRESAKLEAKRAAVLRAKRASWAGESVPVRISGRASTVIREWAKLHNMSFTESLDDLLQRVADDMDVAEMWATRSWAVWEDITPYKSRRMKKSDGEQDAPQDVPQEVKTAQAAKVASKTSSKTASKASASKTSKAAGRKEEKK